LGALTLSILIGEALAISGMWMMNLLWLRVEGTSVLKIE
jgi:hypothetical protein